MTFPTLDNNTSFVYNPEIIINKQDLMNLLNEYYNKGREDALQDVGSSASNSLNYYKLY